MDKAEIRKQGKKGRASVQGEIRKEYQRRICERIRESAEYKSAKRILTYQAFGSEVCIDRINKWAIEDGKILSYPYCTDKTTMIALIPDGEDSWGEDLYGIEVPLPEKSTLLKPQDIDLVLAPLVAFDAQGNRTGMGAGVYDRFLPQCTHARILGVAFEAQKMPAVPTDEHDVTLSGVVTEEARYEGKGA